MGTVNVEQRGTVLIGTFDNPPHGLMDRGSVEALERLVTRAEGDENVDAVVLTGSHPERFVAHYDVAELLAGARAGPAIGAKAVDAALRTVSVARRVRGADRGLERTPLAGLAEVERFHELFLRMNRCGAVFVAAINGSAQGGGSELALACDLRLMASGDHGIGQPEIFLAFPPGGGGTQRLARLLGSAKALKIVLDGTPMGLNEAADLGLVDRSNPARGAVGDGDRGRAAPRRTAEGGDRRLQAGDLRRRLAAAQRWPAARGLAVPGHHHGTGGDPGDGGLCRPARAHRRASAL